MTDRELHLAVAQGHGITAALMRSPLIWAQMQWLCVCDRSGIDYDSTIGAVVACWRWRTEDLRSSVPEIAATARLTALHTEQAMVFLADQIDRGFDVTEKAKADVAAWRAGKAADP